MSNIKKVRYREFRLWLINSLFEWGEYCNILDFFPHPVGKLVYKHGWDMLNDWAEQDLEIYKKHLHESNNYA